MTRQIIINSAPQEKRVAVLDHGRLGQMFIERGEHAATAGNVYLGRVSRVLPGMQAAFVDLGVAKAAFLHAGDLDFRPPDPAAANGDAAEDDATGDPGPQLVTPPIERQLTVGRELIVQIRKEPIGAKGARLTTRIALPGRYIVYLPSADHISVSRRITSEDERSRLLAAVESVRPAKGGLIIRTAAVGAPVSALQADLERLRKVWAEITIAAERSTAPNLLHRDLDAVARAIRDHFTAEVRRVVIDDPIEHRRMRSLAGELTPGREGRIERYEGATPIFEYYGIESQVARALERRVWLNCGGHIVIDQTEALTSIDVNTGRYIGKADQEETARTTNLEAVPVIANQLRLRNIGGIIVIDFIDMQEPENRQCVVDALRTALASDKAQITLLAISEFGLVEMTRQRTRESLAEVLCEPCPTCRGSGRVTTAATAAHEILRRLRFRVASGALPRVLTAVLHPSVAEFLQRNRDALLDPMDREFGLRIVVRPGDHLNLNQYEVTSVPE